MPRTCGLRCVQLQLQLRTDHEERPVVLRGVAVGIADRALPSAVTPSERERLSHSTTSRKVLPGARITHVRTAQLAGQLSDTQQRVSKTRIRIAPNFVLRSLRARSEHLDSAKRATDSNAPRTPIPLVHFLPSSSPLGTFLRDGGSSLGGVSRRFITRADRELPYRGVAVLQ